MENVNRYKIPFKGSKDNNVVSGDTFVNIKIPVSLDFTNMGQRDLINREFVDVEMENAINPIVDYEKVKFKPTFNNENINSISYYLYLNGTVSPSTLDQLGYEYNDVQYNLNSFKTSFLRLYFYDSNITTDQNLIFVIDLFPEVYEEDKIDLGNFDLGKVKPLNQISAKFQSYNGNKFLDRSSDGYNIFYFKNIVTSQNSLELFMRAEFFNTKTGLISNLMTIGTSVDITDLTDNLFTKYTLERNELGNIYRLDTSQQNVSYNASNKNYEINLYRILVN